jgi:hypothetical protein
MLIIHATINKDKGMLKELIPGKTSLGSTTRQYIYDNLLNALENYGLDSDKFMRYLKKLLLVSIKEQARQTRICHKLTLTQDITRQEQQEDNN